MLEELKRTRGEKTTLLEKGGMSAYPHTSGRTHAIADALSSYDELAKRGVDLTLAGRIRLLRGHGGSTFFHFEDATGRIQGYAKKDILGEAAYKTFTDLFDVGDIVEVKGKLFATKKGEKSIETSAIRMLAKSQAPLPEKWHGLSDVEERFRKRYVDLLMNPIVRERFYTRSRITHSLRNFFLDAGFCEVETPTLQGIPGGALAKPFKTHLDTLNLDLYLRVAPELYLKRLLVGGFEQVFEIGRCFRNEGMDKDHNPEFTMLEAYAAYRDYEWLMAFTEHLFVHLTSEGVGQKDHAICLGGATEIRFSPPFARVEFAAALKEATGLDFWESSGSDFLKKVKELGITVAKAPTKVALADELFKKVVRDTLVQPTFVINHPVELSPLAKNHREDLRKVERFQLIVAGMELTNAFSELNDPREQRKRFMAQEQERQGGDIEAHRMDEDYIEALEYGMPPAAGIGIGIDRLARLLTDSKTVREVLLFPTMKPR